MTKQERKCPQCQSTNHKCEHLAQKAAAWPIVFGDTLTKRKELLAYACQDCGYVFLYLGPEK